MVWYTLHTCLLELLAARSQPYVLEEKPTHYALPNHRTPPMHEGGHLGNTGAHEIILSMKPMALAARDPRGPAEMELTRMLYLRPASYASTRVSLSSAALALLMPPP